MTRYRALIVDDSKSARHSLAKLLEAHDLAVEFAVSGEEALEFLKDQLVDVIFMDHTMPGMDGLEAVTAIKGNPRTAMIPVMMYTTKEGEVYVGQARALGAVGVLPKQVQPGVLFDMLHKLGLVTDRRDGDRLPEPDAPRRRFGDLVDEVDREYEQRALGASVQALLTRILDAQHQQLRADVQSSQRRFAKQVAAEILEHGHAREPATPADTPSAAGAGARRRWLPAASIGLLAALLTVSASHWQLRSAHDAALAEVADFRAASHIELSELSHLSGDLAASLESQRHKAQSLKLAAAQALEWALTQDLRVPFDEPPFNEALADRLPELVQHLAALEFRGDIVLTARLGQFCLVRDEYGQWQRAPADLPTAACELVGHPLDGDVSVASLQTVGFADALRAVVADNAGLTIELRAENAVETVGWRADRAYRASRWNRAADWNRAGDWNAAAAQDNRVELSLVPQPDAARAGLAQRP
jgi:CheY-like chemotaxis protein